MTKHIYHDGRGEVHRYGTTGWLGLDPHKNFQPYADVDSSTIEQDDTSATDALMPERVGELLCEHAMTLARREKVDFASAFRTACREYPLLARVYSEQLPKPSLTRSHQVHRKTSGMANVADLVDCRARRYQAEHAIADYVAAVGAVLAEDPVLKRAYHRFTSSGE
jgi:hypothetical protein